MTDDAQWFIGVDWASQTHQACLIDAGGKIIGERAFAHGGTGLAEPSCASGRAWPKICIPDRRPW